MESRVRGHAATPCHRLTVALGERSYDITVSRGGLAEVGRYFALDRRVLVVTDSGVPAAYAETVAAACARPTLVTLPAGEGSKSQEGLTRLLSAMLDASFTRTDAVVAVGGGVVGDLSGLAAALYMRGIDFYNIPTTLLSQVDSSIGGKTAINFQGVKNIVGAFHQPRGVLIDPTLLGTLPPRQMANGAAEIVKMAMTSDAALFERLEREGIAEAALPDIILAALSVKRQVVEQDETEAGLRRILNFGHTLGHGFESAATLHAREGAEVPLLHGESVALGMLSFTAPALRPRLQALLTRLGLPTRFSGDTEQVLAAVLHDKKRAADTISYVYVPTLGQAEIRTVPIREFMQQVREVMS